MSEVVVALDLPDRGAALQLVNRIDELRWVKVGSYLFVREGPGLIEELKRRDLNVFLDLKWFDIPATVGGAAHGAAAIGVDMMTVHAAGGSEMISTAVDAAGDARVVAVTLLTSFDRDSYAAVSGRDDVEVAAEVSRLALLARDSGAHGLVCSGDELNAVRGLFGDGAWFVVPGIRPDGFAHDDQRRTVTPAEAAARGATHLVVGRPVVRADNPADAFRAIVAQVAD